MTTIAYRNGVIAADSLCTNNGVVVGEYEKIVDLHGFLLGGCGAIANVCKFFEWFEESHHGDKPLPLPETLKPKDNDGYTIMYVHKESGRIWQSDNGGHPHRLSAEFMAIGSGMAFAMGAMEVGAGPEEAVAVAIKHDTYSGGLVRALTCETQQKA